jgi:hypothetical protein
MLSVSNAVADRCAQSEASAQQLDRPARPAAATDDAGLPPASA